MKPRPARKKIRLANYDYSTPGAYFITVCVQDRRCVFGEIHQGQMYLNARGKIVQNQWEWLHRQYDYLVLDSFVVMPNHFHAILVIGENDPVRNGRDRSVRDTDSTPGNPDSPHRKFKPVPELMGAFKTTSSKFIHQSGLADFRWQKSYYDHIIRNERELHNIRRYIETNPVRWAMDIENSDNTDTGGKHTRGESSRGGRERRGRERSRPFPTDDPPDNEIDRYYRSIPEGK
ncbi:MAG: transposase [Calditrichaceae bacterium]|nr:hypothetical protein [Calditrichia bacterium]NUQ43425.1 transposase [Calditrichaceae bacterium]